MSTHANAAPKFWAFISYNQREKVKANKLHRALETYKLPARLHPRGSDRPVPRRLFPVFMDRDELASSSCIGEDLKDALRRAQCLVVVCSPRSAASRWVEAEVAYFQSLGRDRRIFCAIIDGEPNSPNIARECFVPSLRAIAAESGEAMLDQRSPIAADMRPGGDGPLRARLKLVAAIAGVSFDELWQRDRRRRRWEWVRVCGGVIGAVGALFSLVQHHEHAKAELIRQERVDRDLEQGRQETLAGNPLRALPFLSDAYSLGAESQSLRFLLARGLADVDDRKCSFSDSTNRIRNADFDRTGRQLWTFHADGTVQAHEPSDGTTVRRLGSSDDPANEIAIAPDGKHVAFAQGSRIIIWDAETGRSVRTLTGHELDIKSLTFDTAGKRLVSASVDDTARIWDAESGRELARLTGHGASVLCAKFSPDGRTVITGSADGTVRVWQSENGKPVAVFRAAPMESSVWSVAQVGLSTDGRWAAALWLDGRAAFWRVSSGELLAVSPETKLCLAFTFDYPEAEIAFAVAAEDGTLEILNVRDTRPIAILSGHRGGVVHAAFSLDGRRLISASWDHTAKVWDSVSGRLLRDLKFVKGQSPMEENLIAAGFSPTGGHVWTLNWAGVATVWGDSRQGMLPSGVRRPQRAGFSRDGTRCFVANATMLEVWNGARPERIASITLDNAVVKTVALNQDGGRIAVVTADERVLLWEIPSRRLLATFLGRTLAFSNDGQRLLVAASKAVLIIDSHNGRISRRLEEVGEFVAAQWSPDESSVATLSANGQAVIWDAVRGTRVRSFAALAERPDYEARVIRRLAVPPGAFRLITADDEDVSLWHAERPALIARFRAHEFALLDLRFDSDGRRLVTSGGDGFVKIWDLENGRVLLNLPCGSDFVYNGGFSPDNSLLLTATSSQRITLWDAMLGRPLANYDGATATFSPDGTQVLMAGQSVSLMALEFESRDAATVRALLERECPWRLVGDHLVAVKPSH